MLISVRIESDDSSGESGKNLEESGNELQDSAADTWREIPTTLHANRVHNICMQQHITLFHGMPHHYTTLSCL